MANPLDGLTQDQSGDDDASLPRRVYVYGDGQPDQGGTPYQPQTINAPLAQAVAPEQPSDLMQGIAALKDYVTNGQFSPGTKVGNRLFGTGGEERYQTWPERMVREGLSAPGDVLASTTPSTSESLIAPAQSVAALAGGGALTETPGAATLGSGPIRAGAKVAEAGPTPVFYSALEHAVENSSQKSASPEQWLGTLKNTPGVKQEELAWSGVGDWLKGQKGKVSKEDVQAYLDANKTEIKDVTKQSRSYEDLSPVELEEAKQAYKDDNGIEDNEPVVWDDVRDHYEEMQAEQEDVGSGGGTKYSQYQLPGGENYREHLLTLPERDNRDPNMTLAQYEAQNYNSSHWDEPNVLAHVRTNDRDVGGKKSLHIEEIQSDWHQQGRKQGYATSNPVLKQKAEQARKDYQTILPEVHKMIEDNGNFGHRDMPDAMRKMRDQGPDVAFPDATPEQKALAWKAYDAFNDANNLAKQVKGGVPDAPFKTTWPELALKRMIRHAAENGYDRISWTPGEAQAARYDLSKQVEGIRAKKTEDGQYHVQYMPKGSQRKDNWTSMAGVNESVPESRLSDLVGKELAKKIVDDNRTPSSVFTPYTGLDLKVGGEGMREFYDKMLPKMAEKIGKSHGVKVKQGEIPGTGEWHGGVDNTPPRKIYDAIPELQVKYPKIADFVDHYNGLNSEHRADLIAEASMKGRQPVHYFDLPQSLKDHAIGKGFPLYMRGIPFPLTPVDHDPFDKDAKALSKSDIVRGMEDPAKRARLDNATREVSQRMSSQYGKDWWTKVPPSKIEELQNEVKHKTDGE